VFYIANHCDLKHTTATNTITISTQTINHKPLIQNTLRLGVDPDQLQTEDFDPDLKAALNNTEKVLVAAIEEEVRNQPNSKGLSRLLTVFAADADAENNAGSDESGNEETIDVKGPDLPPAQLSTPSTTPPSTSTSSSSSSSSSGFGASGVSSSSSSGDTGAKNNAMDFVRVHETGWQKGLLVSVTSVSLNKEIGVVHSPVYLQHAVSLKATCRQHKQCSCWLSCEGRLVTGKQSLVEWLASGLDSYAGEHHAESQRLKLRFGMKVKASKDT
jgi:hypothetical protein